VENMPNSIRSLMSHSVISVQPNQTVQEAAQLMSQHNIGAIPVVENGQVKGIITDRDITLRSTAQGLDANAPVSACMSTNVIQGSPDMDVHEASQLMAQHQVRRLPIVENNQLVGFVSLGDLAVQDQYQNEAGEALSNISSNSNELQ
jgi:CBS domain-containing protein